MKLVDLFIIIALSLTPAVEARGAFLYAFGLEYMGRSINYPLVFATIYFFSTLPSVPIIVGLRYIEEKLINRFRFLKLIYDKTLSRVRSKAQRIARSKSIYIALTVFIAVPLPGTGVWTGSLIAYTLGLNGLKAFIPIVLGNFISCLILLIMVLFFKTII